MAKTKDPAAVKLGQKGGKQIAKRGPEYFRQLQAKRKKHKGGQVKELRVRPKIGGHDLEIKIQHMREFFAERDQVRLTIIFRGREMEHKELGTALVTKVRTSVADVAFVEQEAQMEGTRLSLLFAPKK